MTLTLGVLIACASIGGALIARSRAESPAPPATLPRAAIAVAVTRVIDGDTLEVRSAETTIRVRLYGVDAPEAGEACAEDATRRLAALAGTVVRLVPDARLTDQFGRELRYVYTDDGVSIDTVLVRDGLARAWREDGAQREALIALEQEAQSAQRGCLWAPPGASGAAPAPTPASGRDGGVTGGALRSS
jgi:micrococcal nuclease